MAQLGEYKEVSSMYSTKGVHELQKENSRDEQGAWKDWASDSLPMIYATVVHLWSATRRIHKLQTPGSGHEDPRESETSQRVM